MKRQAAKIANSIRAALASGKLQAKENYTVPALALLLGTSRGELSDIINRDYGTIVAFGQEVGLTGMKVRVLQASAANLATR